MDFDAVWEETKAGLAEAYRDLVGFAVAAVEAAVVVLVATFVARWLKGRVRRALAKSKLEPNTTALAVNAAAIATYVVAATFVLGVFGANWTAVLALLGVATLALSLALQDVLKSVVAGIYLLLERPFSIGDQVRVKDVTGRVESIDFRTTVLRNDREERVHVPNATVFAEIVINRSARGTAHKTVTLKGLAPPLVELRDAVVGVAQGMDGLREPAPRVTLAAAGADGAEATLTVWHETNADVLPALISRLRERFPEATVTVGEE